MVPHVHGHPIGSMPFRLSVVVAGVLVVAALTGGLWMRALNRAAQPLAASAAAEQFREISPEAAASLGRKIVAIRRAEVDVGRTEREAVLASEIEMESFILYSMEDEIPARVELIDVEIGTDLISAATELTFDSEEGSGNAIVDALLGGTHSLFIEGRLTTTESGRGQFELRRVRVDGLPVPLLVIQVLVRQFVTPRYPQVDLDAPFGIPWGIEEVALTPELATITY